jgi:hypothetical protein
MNKRDPQPRWEHRLKVIHRVFPSVVDLDWERVFDEEPEVLGRIVQDIIRSIQATPGKSGPRPVLDPRRAQPVMDRWLGLDPTERPYAVLPFAESFRLLVGERSVRHVAARLGWVRDRVWRLLNGRQEPSPADMEHIAEAFGKRPSYFVEYRIAWAVHVFMSSLEVSPEETIRVYESLQQATG